MTVPILGTVKLACTTGLPEDTVDWDFAFLAEDTDDTTLDGIRDSLIALFNTAPAHAMGTYISGTRSRASNTSTVAFYDLTGHLDGSPHGSPIYTAAWTLTAAESGHTNLPDEVAIKVSWIAAGWEDVPEQAPNPTPPPSKFRPRSRYRGGVFTGPWTTTSLSDSSGGNTPRPSSTIMSYIGEAFVRFQDERPDWAVWSRVDEVLRPLAVGGDTGSIWIDNAFDTQRRRGPAATTRTVFWP